MAWLLDLHVNLLAGKTGSLVNGAGAVFVLALSLTGAVLWWPGIRTWRRSLAIQPSSNWKLFNWQLHSVIGLWTLPYRVHVWSGWRLCGLPCAVSGSGEQDRAAGFLSPDPGSLASHRTFR